MSPTLFFVGGAMAWFVTWWFVLPLWSRISHQVPASAHDLPEKFTRDGPHPPRPWGRRRTLTGRPAG
jgi:hypothetical protein